jgi:Flp pilus assembly pilin Flp
MSLHGAILRLCKPMRMVTKVTTEARRPQKGFDSGRDSRVYTRIVKRKGGPMNRTLVALWSEDDGQDIAEYAVMVAVILIVVVGTLRVIGSNSNTVFSQVASSIG